MVNRRDSIIYAGIILIYSVHVYYGNHLAISVYYMTTYSYPHNLDLASCVSALILNPISDNEHKVQWKQLVCAKSQKKGKNWLFIKYENFENLFTLCIPNTHNLFILFILFY